jgi:hypothetical protein
MVVEPGEIGAARRTGRGLELSRRNLLRQRDRRVGDLGSAEMITGIIGQCGCVHE